MSKRLPLDDYHRANGAEFFERDGWRLPLHFGNPESEYDAVRSRSGLLDLSYRALVEFSGPDRASFLQGMISNDLRDLAPGNGVYATFLNQQGKVLADSRVLSTEDVLWVDLWEPLRDKILGHVKRYLVADEVEINDLSAQYGVISLQGPEAAAWLRQIAKEGELPVQPLQHAIIEIADAPVRALRQSHTGEDGYDLFIPTDKLEQVVRSLAAKSAPGLSTSWVGEQAANVLRIEAGIARYGVDFSEDNLLLETGLDHAVSFTKGCYLGQEVVERIRSRGHVNKKLVGLLLDELCEPGSRVLAGGREIGALTSAAFSPALRRVVALGYVQRDCSKPQTSLNVSDRDRVVAATVTSLPFLKSTRSTARNAKDA